MISNHPSDTFTSYDYLTVEAPRGKDALYRDTYGSFGWRRDDEAAPARNQSRFNLKRDRNIRATQELAALQASAEGDLARIDSLERSRKIIPAFVAYSVGLVGAVFLGFSMYALENTTQTASIVLGAVGIAFWLAAPLANGLLRSRRSARVAPLIDQHLDRVHATCEQADTVLRRVA